MFFTENEILKHTQSLVQRFVDSHYVEESRYLPVLWQKFIRQVSGTGSIAFAQRRRDKQLKFDILSFAEARNISLVTPFAIMTVAAVLQEMNLQTVAPPVERIRNAINACATEFGASRNLIDQMEQYIAESLYQVFKQVTKPSIPEKKRPIQEQKLVIDVNILKPIKINNKIVELQPRQTVILFCEFVRKKRLHWAHGFVLYERWHRFPPPNPKRRFENIIDKLNMAFRQCNAIIEVKPEKVTGLNTGFSNLVSPTNVIFAGDVAEARSLYEKAQQSLELGKIEESIEILQASFEKDPDSLDMMLLFSKVIYDNTTAPFDKDIVHSLWHKLYLEEVRIRDAVFILKKEGEKAQWKENWASVIALRSEFEQNLSEISEAKIVIDSTLHGKEALSSEDLEFRKLSDLIDKIRSVEDYSNFIERFAEFKTVTDVFKIVRNRLTRIFKQFNTTEPNQIDTTILRIFTEDICRKGKHPGHYGNCVQLRRSWISELSRKTGENILEDIYSIDKKKQRLMRQYVGTLKKIGRHPSMPSDREILSKLGRKWNVCMLQEAKAIQQEMALLKDIVDIEGYWSLFKKR